MHLAIVIALSLQMMGTYVIWPSRWNIPAHLALGFSVTAYLFPGLATHVWDSVDAQTVQLYGWINIIGAVALLWGLIVGRHLALFDGARAKLLRLYESPAARIFVLRRTELMARIGVVGMTAAYILMGFVPMFAKDPFAARQFKDQYLEPYRHVAYLYRGSFWLLVSVIPLLLVIWWIRKRRVSPLVLAGSAVVLLALSLDRGPFATGVLTFLGIVAGRSRRNAIMFLILCILIFPVGSAVYLLVGLLTHAVRFTTIYAAHSFAGVLAAGAPDIHDQLTFLNGFQYLSNFTWGRTIWGGLIPFNYEWNPSVWTLTYNNVGGSVTHIVSGGLRLTTALWGYSNFGWFGVLLIPFVSGVLNGAVIRVIRQLPFAKSLIASAVVMLLYTTLGSQLTQWYLLSVQNIPAIVVALYLCYGMPVWSNTRQSILSPPVSG